MELKYYINGKLYYYGVKVTEQDIADYFKVDILQAKRFLPYIDTETLASDTNFENYMTEKYRENGIDYIKTIWKL